MMQGEGLGAKIRGQWWGVNNWPLPEEARVGRTGVSRKGEGLAGQVGEVSSNFLSPGFAERLRWVLSGKSRS